MVTLDDIQRTLLNIERLLRRQAKTEPQAPSEPPPDQKQKPSRLEEIAMSISHWLSDQHQLSPREMLSQELALQLQSAGGGVFDELELRFSDYPRPAQTADVLAAFFKSRTAWVVKLHPMMGQHQRGVALTSAARGYHFVVEGPGVGYLLRIRAAGR